MCISKIFILEDHPGLMNKDLSTDWTIFAIQLEKQWFNFEISACGRGPSENHFVRVWDPFSPESQSIKRAEKGRNEQLHTQLHLHWLIIDYWQKASTWISKPEWKCPKKWCAVFDLSTFQLQFFACDELSAQGYTSLPKPDEVESGQMVLK